MILSLSRSFLPHTMQCLGRIMSMIAANMSARLRDTCLQRRAALDVVSGVCMAVRGIDRYKYMPGMLLRTPKREKLIFKGADFSLFCFIAVNGILHFRDSVFRCHPDNMFLSNKKKRVTPMPYGFWFTLLYCPSGRRLAVHCTAAVDYLSADI